MKHITYLLLAFASLLMTACDAHQDFPDTTIKPCHILCTDGKVVPYSQYEAENKQAIAVVFNTHKGENMEGTGYAVYLWDIEPVAFSDSLGCAQGTSADLMAHDGNLNTYKMYEGKEVGSPLANSVFAIWAYGQSAYIHSAVYMKSWLDSLKESPSFIKTTLMDVKRATSVITQRIDEVALELEAKQSQTNDKSVSMDAEAKVEKPQQEVPKPELEEVVARSAWHR